MADRAFLRDVLGLPHVDVGEGWLIFGLPPSELAVHPSSKNDVHELYLMCDDVSAFVATLQARGIRCEGARDMGWGVLTQVALPGGGKLGVYQPRHARPKPARPRRTAQPRAAQPRAGNPRAAKARAGKARAAKRVRAPK